MQAPTAWHSPSRPRTVTPGLSAERSHSESSGPSQPGAGSVYQDGGRGSGVLYPLRTHPSALTGPQLSKGFLQWVGEKDAVAVLGRDPEALTPQGHALSIRPCCPPALGAWEVAGQRSVCDRERAGRGHFRLNVLSRLETALVKSLALLGGLSWSFSRLCPLPAINHGVANEPRCWEPRFKPSCGLDRARMPGSMWDLGFWTGYSPLVSKGPRFRDQPLPKAHTCVQLGGALASRAASVTAE